MNGRTPKPRRFTNREQEIVALVAEGNSNKEIARVLGLSVKTVSCHLSRLFVRNGIHTRTQAVLSWLALQEDLENQGL